VAESSIDGAAVSSSSPDALPAVSIVIPVFNQREELLRCLRALSLQTYPADRFEVIVIDNGSEVPVASPSETFPRVRCLLEPKPGSYAARNRGIEASRGQIVGLTDADCVPAPDWIAQGVEAVTKLGGPGMIGGRIELTLDDAGNPTTAELFESVLGFPQETYIKWGFAATANVFTTRSTFDVTGLFDERLLSGGDMEWGQRVRDLNLPQTYAEQVRVRHAARRSVRELLRKARRVAGGVQQVAQHRGTGTSGLRSRAVRQLLLLGRIRANLGHQQLDTFGKKLRFAGAVWLIELVHVLERYRVHFGGTAGRT
jgi:glycosyltransferase involved in cell wall biosynthesis